MVDEREFGYNRERRQRPRTHYEVLGVSEDATAQEIKNAFRKKAIQFHPDKPENKGKEEEMKLINVAYDVLSDPISRRLYDEKLAGERSGFGNSYPPPHQEERSAGSQQQERADRAEESQSSSRHEPPKTEKPTFADRFASNFAREHKKTQEQGQRLEEVLGPFFRRGKPKKENK